VRFTEKEICPLLLNKQEVFMKRVVTGHDKDGKSVFVKIGEPEHVSDFPGVLSKELWATFPDCKVPVEDASAEPTRKYKSVFPFPGETRFRIVEYDPADGARKTQENSSPEDMAALMQRIQKEAPGLIEHLEEGSGGMHTTDSIDYGIVLKGNVVLELDDGKTVDLEAGDIIIQNGTRHMWSPQGKCTMLFVLIGAERK
jgi:mannose-6-phosphate isomerase-like protein (cupin superfamily)